MKKMLLTGFLVAALAGCGGGGGSSTPAPAPVPQTSSAEGMWNGVSSSNTILTGFILDDGTYYVAYTDPGITTIKGVILGSSSAVNGVFTSVNAKDFYFGSNPYFSAANVTANYLAKQSMSGVFSRPDSSRLNFNATYDLRYENIPDLTKAAGSYRGDMIIGNKDSRPLVSSYNSLSVSTTGEISGVHLLGCYVNGNATPRLRGNLFNVSLTFTGCGLEGQTLRGIMFSGTDKGSLFIAAPTSDMNGGFVFSGNE